MFRGWSVVVLLEDARQKEVYRRMLELGGASVHRWTLSHLLDSQANASPPFKALTHVVAQPGMFLQEHFHHWILHHLNQMMSEILSELPVFLWWSREIANINIIFFI